MSNERHKLSDKPRCAEAWRDERTNAVVIDDNGIGLSFLTAAEARELAKWIMATDEAKESEAPK